MGIQLRPYQQEALDAAWEYVINRDGDPLTVMPTGSGKSIVVGSFIKKVVEEYPGTRVMCATHVAELVEQNHSKLKLLMPDLPIGIHSAGLNKRDMEHDVLFAGVQSVYRKGDNLRPFDFLLIDEAHLVPKKSEGMYRRLIDDLRANNSDLRILGYTATPYRLDSGLLTEQPNNIFTSVCYDADVIRLIDEGWLSTIVPHVGKAQYDTSGLRLRGGEFSAPDLNRMLDESEKVTQAAVEEVLAEGADRKSWLIFCGSVKQASLVNEMIRSAGVHSELVTGETRKPVRRSMVERFREGSLRCLINVGVFTTGFDAPNVDLIAMMRPTHSPGLHVQMLGRGMRLSPATGKENCLALDFGGNVERHGPINRVRIPKKKGTGEAPIKMCPECKYDGIHASALVCPECGYEFPPREVTVRGRSLLDIISRTFRQKMPVTSVRYGLHKKNKSNGVSRTLRVDYYAGLSKTASEFICIEHSGYAGQKAMRWLKARLSEDEFELLFPLTIEAVLEIKDKIKVPRELLLDTSEKHPKIITHFL